MSWLKKKKKKYCISLTAFFDPSHLYTTLNTLTIIENGWLKGLSPVRSRPIGSWFCGLWGVERKGCKPRGVCGGGECFVQSDCERTAVAEDVLYTVINFRPNVIYGPHHGCFVGHFGATSLKLCKQQVWYHCWLTIKEDTHAHPRRKWKCFALKSGSAHSLISNEW